MKKLINKKTSEIGRLSVNMDRPDNGIRVYLEDGVTYRMYNSLAELNEKWEDYEEPKGKALYWMILTLENFIKNEPNDEWMDLEDCKRMLERLKALMRLKEKGFSFDGWNWKTQCIDYNLDYTNMNDAQTKEADKDLDLVFGGEE